MIVLSNAHHRKWPGAVNKDIGMSEYIYSIEINRRILNLFSKERPDEILYLLDTSWKESYRESLREKVRLTNIFRPDVAIENHLNSFENPIVQGCECLYFKDSIKGEQLAQSIQDQLITMKEFKTDRGIHPRDDVFFLKATTCPTVITEPLFLSHSSAVALLDEKFLDTLAKAIFQGIVKYLEE